MFRGEIRFREKVVRAYHSQTCLLSIRYVISHGRHFLTCAQAYFYLKIDLAPYVGASLEVMDRDSKKMRGDGPTVFTSVKENKGVEDVVDLILAAWRMAGSPGMPGAVGDVE